MHAAAHARRARGLSQRVAHHARRQARGVRIEDQHAQGMGLETSTLLRTLEGHTSSVNAVAITPDGERALSGSWDRTLKVWELASRCAAANAGGACRLGPRGGHHTRWQACGVRLVDRTLKVWDLDTGALLRTLEGHARMVIAVAITLDGKRAVSGSGTEPSRCGSWRRVRAAHARGARRFGLRGSDHALRQARGVRRRRTPRSRCGTLETGHAAAHAGRTRRLSLRSSHHADGKRAVSALVGHDAQYLGARQRRTVRTLKGTRASLYGGALTPEGKRALSGFRDDDAEPVSRAFSSWLGHSGSCRPTLASLRQWESAPPPQL